MAELLLLEDKSGLKIKVPLGMGIRSFVEKGLVRELLLFGKSFE